MIDNKCLNCKWLEEHNGEYICGYMAEVFHIEVKIEPDMKCIGGIKCQKK